jgi:molecular chaperone HscB
MSAPDYFAFFGLEPKLSIDAAGLEERFYRLSRELHPDRFSRAAPAERAQAEQAAATLNDAYRTLRDPIARAEYLLRREGFEAPDGRKPPANLLEEVFETSQALEDLRGGDESARTRLEEARVRMRVALTEGDARLRLLFEDYDRLGDRALLAGIRAWLDQRKYLGNLLAQIESEPARP